MTTTRRLAAIMAADVAGFSAAMERDEEGTFALVQELRRKIIEPNITEHQGRLIKTTGDGFLAEFASPIAAMRAALAIQQAASAQPLQLRIGMNLGDVIIEEGGDAYGEGVNVAARLEGLADPGGILISAKVHSEVEGKIAAAFEDRGEHQVKNIARPVRVYAVRSGPATRSASVSTSADSKPLPLPDKPSIAVLPFQNMSGDPEQEYFADGMVEDIITALSRFKSLFVIARNSSFTYKGKAIDIKRVGRELGVRYVLEGSVRKAGGRVRITGQLIEAATGSHLWADHFDGALTDIFDLQDGVTLSVVGAVVPSLDQAESRRALIKSTDNLDAYDYILRGRELLRSDSFEGNSQALEYFRQAIQLDRTCAGAFAGAAGCYFERWRRRWMKDLEAEAAEGRRFADQALALGDGDAAALSSAAGYIVFVSREVEQGRNILDRALIINPNLASAWSSRGWTNIWMGLPDLAIADIEKAIRLSPLDTGTIDAFTAMGGAHLLAGRSGEALEWTGKALARRPNWLPAVRISMCANAQLERLDEANRCLQQLLALVPNMTISATRRILPFQRATDMEEHVRLCRLAGMPE